jgi:hypothetical protein
MLASPCHLGLCDLPDAKAPAWTDKVRRFDIFEGVVQRPLAVDVAVFRSTVFFVDLPLRQVESQQRYREFSHNRLAKFSCCQTCIADL